MKLKEISSSTLVDEPNVEAYNFDLVGDDHISTSYDTPIRSDAFDISDKEKKNIIADALDCSNFSLRILFSSKNDI